MRAPIYVALIAAMLAFFGLAGAGVSERRHESLRLRHLFQGRPGRPLLSLRSALLVLQPTRPLSQ